MEHFRIYYNLMVREIAVRWNPIYDSILVMYQKLLDLEPKPSSEKCEAPRLRK